MHQATPAEQDLARLLLALELDQNNLTAKQIDTIIDTILSVFEKLRLHLSRLVGTAGFQALLARALALAKRDAPWLEPVRVQENATLTGFNEAAQQQTSEAVAKGGENLLTQLLGLLITFIGKALTLYLVQEVWPEAKMDDTKSGEKETRI